MISIFDFSVASGIFPSPVFRSLFCILQIQPCLQIKDRDDLPSQRRNADDIVPHGRHFCHLLQSDDLFNLCDLKGKLLSSKAEGEKFYQAVVTFLLNAAGWFLRTRLDLYRLRPGLLNFFRNNLSLDLSLHHCLIRSYNQGILRSRLIFQPLPGFLFLSPFF